MAKFFSIASKSIRYKLVIAVSLMSVLPVLILLNYIFPSYFLGFISSVNFPSVFLILITISGLGFIILKQIFDLIMRLSSDARKSVIDGDFTQGEIEKNGADEVGQLGLMLSQLSRRIEKNMSELKDYSTKTAQINLDIQKRVAVLSALLQMATIITQGTRLDDILNICVDRAKNLGDSQAAFLLFQEETGRLRFKVQQGLDEDVLNEVKLLEHDESLSQIFKKRSVFAADSRNSNPAMRKLLPLFGLKNMLCAAIYLRKHPIAILAVGNKKEGFTYNTEDYDLLDIFAKQVGIALENDFLTRRVEELEVNDALTGLYNKQYIHNRLDEEIKRAIMHQRPCSFILAQVKDFASYHDSCGLIASEAALKKIASCLKSSLTEVDRVGRYDDSLFSIVLPEKNKRQSQKIAEELQGKVEYLFKDEPEISKKLSIAVSVAENPLDGISADELVACAQKSLWPQQGARV